MKSDKTSYVASEAANIGGFLMYIICKVEDRKCPLGYARLMFPMAEKDFKNLMLFAGYQNAESLAITEIDYIYDNPNDEMMGCKYYLDNILPRLKDFKYEVINRLAIYVTNWLSTRTNCIKLIRLLRILDSCNVETCDKLEEVINDIETLTFDELVKKYPEAGLENWDFTCHCDNDNKKAHITL